MKTLRFKTNINCNNCVRTVSAFLNEVPTIREWSVDVGQPEKILTVKGEEVLVEEVIEAVEEAGFDIVEDK